MQTYFLCLSSWTIITNVSIKMIQHKHLTYVAMVHTSTCIYLLYNNHNELAIINTLAYFTSDFIQMVYTNYYDQQNVIIFSFHHIISMVTLLTTEKENVMYPLMLKVFLDVERSNVALNIFYITSKITRCKEILCIANGIEALVYGYYRVGLVKHCIIELMNNNSITDIALFGAMYSFGVFFTGVLLCTTYNRIYNLFC